MTEFAVGDLVTWDSASKWWQGGKAKVISLTTEKYPGALMLEILEPVPSNPSNTRVGSTVPDFPYNVKLWEAPAVKDDAVDSPSHYTQYPVEVIELTRHMNFGRGNSVKYIARAGFKGGPEKELEDLLKARWYLNDEIATVQKKLEEAK